MKEFVILLGLVLIKDVAGVNSYTAEEISPHGIVDLWNNCNSDVEMETLVGNDGEPMKPLLSNKNVEDCKNRVKNNIFILIDKNSVEDFQNIENESFMYVHDATDAMLNVKKKEIVPHHSPSKKEYMIAELVPKHLKKVIKVLDFKPILQPILNPPTHHGVFTADSSGRLTIHYDAITYIDFGAHAIYEILGFRSTGDITKNMYYQTDEELVLSNKYIPGQSYNVTWKTAMTTFAANVRLTLCSFFIGKTTATVAAILIEEKISKDTIKVEIIETSTTTEAPETEKPAVSTTQPPTETTGQTPTGTPCETTTEPTATPGATSNIRITLLLLVLIQLVPIFFN
ncbi:uncharacterized protein LOC129804173 [Phlebotomus papatasi]|uniref:uncharacterized protein LOC129804173 n=1 Tax=Phlebotomus papatasi TaxID=29031 RepID=UPI002483CDDE|nr:uncharacterized protein LOC129804173 [Phlebotomus papatasi]